MTQENATATRILEDDDIKPAVVGIIARATERVILVSPYNRFWDDLKTVIEHAVGKGVRFELVLRKGQRDKDRESIDWLNSRGARIFEVEGLHAKIYRNEQEVLLTSMNLTERKDTDDHSEDHYKEIGILMKDDSLIRVVAGYINKLKKEGDRLPKPGQQDESIAGHNGDCVSGGYCIRCKAEVAYNVNAPLCGKDYASFYPRVGGVTP